MPPSTTLLAVRLLGRWTQLGQLHVPLGSGCACGPGFEALPLRDIEQQLLDHLLTKHDAKGESVEAILKGLAKEKDISTGKNSMLADIERSLDSVDELHRRGRV